jgi:hypothetical protein
MKKLISLLFVGLFSVSVFAQSNGGIINKKFNAPDSLTPWNADQSIASITQPYTSKKADSTACTISSKYGSSFRLAQIRNLSGTMQRYTVILRTGDTTQYVCEAYGTTGRTPFIKRVISGAVVDSTAYDFLWMN